MKRDGLSAVLPVSAAAVEQMDSWMPECYSGDDYPREGCTVVLIVDKDAVGFNTYAPNGKLLEAGPTLPRNVAGSCIQDWLNGLVPRVKHSDRNPTVYLEV